MDQGPQHPGEVSIFQSNKIMMPKSSVLRRDLKKILKSKIMIPADIAYVWVNEIPCSPKEGRHPKLFGCSYKCR